MWENYSDEIRESSFLAGERGDCTVIAWANVFDCSYQKAHKWMQIHGRKKRKGMTLDQIKNALKACTKAKVKFGPYDRNNKITISKFLKKHPVGRYYITVRGHAACVKNGILYDYNDSLRRQIHFAARVYLEGEL